MVCRAQFSEKTATLENFFPTLEKIFSCLEKLFSSVGNFFSWLGIFPENKAGAAGCLLVAFVRVGKPLWTGLAVVGCREEACSSREEQLALREDFSARHLF